MRKTLIIVFILLVAFIAKADESWKLYDTDEVAIIEITIDPEALDWVYNNVWSDSLHVCTVHYSNEFINETIENVGFRLRGNTSRISQKKSFKLSFNTFVPGRQFYNVEKINLNGEHNDPSIIRSELCWEQYEEIRQKSSRSSYAAVYINDDYYGLYISVEHIDEEFLEKNYEDDSGNLWKCHYLARLNYLGSNEEDYKFENNGNRVYELKTNTEEDDYSQLMHLIDVLNNTDPSNIADSLESIIDISSVLKYMAVDVICGNWDDYWYGKNNYYIYYEPDISKFHIIPFDYDNNFGVDWMGIDWTQRDIYVFKHPDADRPLADRFLELSEYKNLYSHFLEFYVNHVFELELWEEQIDSIKDTITPFAEEDLYRTMDYGFTMDDFHNSYTEEHYENMHVKRGIKEFINLRNESILQQIDYENTAPVIYNADWQPRIPQASQAIEIKISAYSHIGMGTMEILFYPENEETPVIYAMNYSPIEESKCAEDHDRWIGELPALDNFAYGYMSIRATDTNGQIQYYPRNSRIYIQAVNNGSSDIVINELLAKNDDNNFDEAGDFDDWLELYNNSSNEVNIGGMFLSDNIANLDKWEIPAETYIAAGGFATFWCDEEQEEGSNHTNFKLSGNGESVYLVSQDGQTVLDLVTFGQQEDDISWGRYPDGGIDFMTLSPSFGSSNSTVDADNESIQDPLENIRLSNYPNPFNPVTTIYFETTERIADMEVLIYNIRGQLVDVLINNIQKTTNQQMIIWDASEFSSGIYYYKLNFEGSPVKRMVLMK